MVRCGASLRFDTHDLNTVLGMIHEAQRDDRKTSLCLIRAVLRSRWRDFLVDLHIPKMQVISKTRQTPNHQSASSGRQWIDQNSLMPLLPICM
jgi:hypothetical protein